MTSKVRTRFAPSPTGVLHIGSARTALFNYVFARQHMGEFILRIEDTDKERSSEEFEKDIKRGLEWLGLSADKFYKQSEHTESHKKYLEKLIETGFAYVSKEEIKKEGDREEVIRFKNPNIKITFNDLIRGEITFDTKDLGDFVIAKDMESPLYHLAVVIDDHEAKITHVIRGEDMLSNTPRQILIQEALQFTRPEYAHIPLILAEDRSKLSKRHGAVSVSSFKDKGYLPEAFTNFLMFMGWNPGDEKEIFTLDEIIDVFKIEKVQKGGALFNLEKLDWLNKKYLDIKFKNNYSDFIKQLADESTEVQEYLKNKPDILTKLSGYILEKIHKISDIHTLIEDNEISYFFDSIEYSQENLVERKANIGIEKTKKHLTWIKEKFTNISEDDFVNSEKLKRSVWDYASDNGRGEVLWPLRYALSGRERSAEPFFIASIIGKKETLLRLENAIK